MSDRRAQNIIAESRLLLPVMVCYSALVWFLAGMVEQRWYVQFAIFIVSAYLMIELNNKNALIRIYSRMMSTAFAALIVATGLFASLSAAIVQLCFILYYSIAFTTYQDKDAPGLTFYSFLMISIGSIFFPHLLYFVPFLWIAMAFSLQSLSLRNFSASVCGLLLPYFFYAGYELFRQGDFSVLIANMTSLTEFDPLENILMVPINRTVTVFFLIVVYIIGAVHFAHNAFHDKIRTRMLFYLFMWITPLAMVFLILQPQHYDFLIRIVIINVSPLIAHYLSLTHTRITNISFYILIVVSLLITAMNIWME